MVGMLLRRICWGLLVGDWYARIVGIEQGVAMGVGGYDVFDAVQRDFRGSVIPSILIVGLPAWVIAFRKTFNLVIDFASPISAWIVQRFGSFRSLATTEGVEGVLCLAVALVPNGWTYWKWLLLALSCLLLMTGRS